MKIKNIPKESDKLKAIMYAARYEPEETFSSIMESLLEDAFIWDDTTEGSFYWDSIDLREDE